MKEKKATKVSNKTHSVVSLVHKAFMQPKQTSGNSLRKQYWLEAWTEIKNLTPEQLEELEEGLETIRYTLRKLIQKVDQLKDKKLHERASGNRGLEELNEWEQEEFLDSSSNLPVFRNSSGQKKAAGKRWVITKAMEKPKTMMQVCQAVWVVITNRAIYLVDGGKKNVAPSPSRDLQIEKHRLAVLPHFLDDKIVTDPKTGKPLMNLYVINNEIKETLLWLLAERAKSEKEFRKLYLRFLKKEVIGKEKLFEWAKGFSYQARKIIKEIQ